MPYLPFSAMCVIGDRLYTDIALGETAEIPTTLFILIIRPSLALAGRGSFCRAGICGQRVFGQDKPPKENLAYCLSCKKPPG